MFGAMHRFASKIARRAKPSQRLLTRPIAMLGEEDEGFGDEEMLGAIDVPVEAQDQMLLGETDDCGADDGAGDDGDYADDGGYADDGNQYADDGSQDGGQDAQAAAPSGPDAMSRAMSATGGAIKGAASDAYGVVKDVLSPIGNVVRIATTPIHVVAQGAKKLEKYATMPFKAISKVFSFLGEVEDVPGAYQNGVSRILPGMLGYVDDPDYEPGDEFWEPNFDDGEEEEVENAPQSQQVRYRTEEVAQGVWQGQVTLPTKEAGKSFSLTTTPAPDEKSAMERMYNLTQKAASTPAMMALLNPVGFGAMMLMKGASKSGGVFRAIGSAVSTGAKAIGRGAEAIAETATSW
jgi:hypothetical protein